MKYDFQAIEKKWQARWEEEKPFAAITGDPRPKFYGLIEFPYPSGQGLHVGHPRPFTAMDIICRKRRMQGYNVLFPIGFDAFGLPTENYAIKNHIHPAVVTKNNIANFTKQLKMLGYSFDWDRAVDTTDPAYYKWTQWIFLQMYKHGLAYKTTMPVNWCTSCKCVLANEEVVNGVCERCGSEVVRKEKSQWMLAITKYAQRLIDDLELSLVDDALFGTVRIDETKRNAPDVTLVGDFQRLSRNQRQLGLIAFGVDILNTGILGRERVILVELAGHIFTLGKRVGIFARNRIEVGHEKVTRLFERHPPFGYGMLGIREGHIIVVRLHALDRAEVPRQRNFIQQHLVCVISHLRSVGILAQSVIGNRQRFSAGFDFGGNTSDAGREELDREIRFRGFSDVRGVYVDLPIGDSVAGNRKIDGSGRLFDGNFDGIVGDQHAVHIHKPCRRREIDRIDGGSFRSICLFAVSGCLDRVDGGFDFPYDTVADQGIPAFWHVGVAG